jgi:hypothetical protein
MTEENPKQALDNLSRKTAILLAFCASPFYFLFLFLGDSGRGRAAAICAFVILLCAKIFWSLRGHVLFWVALTIVTLCHIPPILLIQWGNRNYPGVAMLPLAFLDFCIVYGALKLVEKFTKRSGQSTGTTLEA